MTPRIPTLVARFGWLRERADGPTIVGDLISAYALSVARVLAAAAVVGLLYRYATVDYVAVFVVARSTLALATYAFAGLNPTAQRLFALRPPDAAEAMAAIPIDAVLQENATRATEPTLEYQPRLPGDARAAHVLSDAVTSRQLLCYVAFATAMLALPVAIGLLFYAAAFQSVHRSALGYRDDVVWFVSLYGFGVLFRLVGEGAGGISQARGRLKVDNWVQSISEVGWIFLAWLTIRVGGIHHALWAVGVTYLLTGVCVAVGRWLTARDVTRHWVPDRRILRASDGALIWPLIFGSLTLSVGHLADFLYGPSNVLIINRLLAPALVAEYAPALQIDGALLLGVGAMATVLLPRVVAASQADDRARVRNLYLRASLAAFAALITGALCVMLLRDVLLARWFGTVPPVTRAILPLVLVHTVIGGTAGIGRAVLLGLGRFKAYTISALVGGVANVVLALTFVSLGFGLRGIVWATIVAVAARCAIWMPWYVWRVTRGQVSLAP